MDVGVAWRVVGGLTNPKGWVKAPPLANFALASKGSSLKAPWNLDTLKGLPKAEGFGLHHVPTQWVGHLRISAALRKVLRQH